MERASATLVARRFSEFLRKAANGSRIQVLKRGRTVARLVPACDFIKGSRAADLFRTHTADPEVAEAIAAELHKLRCGGHG